MNMEQETKKKKRKSTATIRKASTKGTTTQKMMTFRVDLVNWEHLQGVPNKGKLINDLLEAHFKKAAG